MMRLTTLSVPETMWWLALSFTLRQLYTCAHSIGSRVALSSCHQYGLRVHPASGVHEDILGGGGGRGTSYRVCNV
jgi:hypothetical protein